MISTGFFFVSLIKKLGIDLTCDIGSCDGANALMFKKAMPNSHVIAFEANPHNYNSMIHDERLEKIEIHNLAVFDKNQDAEFFVVEADYQSDLGDNNFERGMSSLLERNDIATKEKVKVRCTRLDAFFGQHSLDYDEIALWIDVEGVGYQAFCGASDILNSVWLVHMELDKAEFAEGLKTPDEVEASLKEFGFIKIASNDGLKSDTVDYVFANLAHYEKIRPHIAFCRAKEFLIYQLKIYKLISRCLGETLTGKLKMAMGRFLT